MYLFPRMGTKVEDACGKDRALPVAVVPTLDGVGCVWHFAWLSLAHSLLCPHQDSARHSSHSVSSPPRAHGGLVFGWQVLNALWVGYLSLPLAPLLCSHVLGCFMLLGMGLSKYRGCAEGPE